VTCMTVGALSLADADAATAAARKPALDNRRKRRSANGRVDRTMPRISSARRLSS